MERLQRAIQRLDTAPSEIEIEIQQVTNQLLRNQDLQSSNQRTEDFMDDIDPGPEIFYNPETGNAETGNEEELGDFGDDFQQNSFISLEEDEYFDAEENLEDECEFSALPSEMFSNPILSYPLFPGSHVDLKTALLMFLRWSSENHVSLTLFSLTSANPFRIRFLSFLSSLLLSAFPCKH